MASLMNNAIISISRQEFAILKCNLQKKKRAYIVELDGNNIQSWNDYIIQVQNKFKFPTLFDSIDGYLDWMTDLDWLDSDEYVMFITNFNQFFKHDIETKNAIIDNFKEIILPFWQDGVKSEVIGGKPKPFMLYLVN